ncbi:MAG: TetR/AcrR family transcriptional regulator [Chloroflexi bacterium]|nr:MAG: TetR/AcrR family transcriptional regulator [Chloroflexota bacterium]
MQSLISRGILSPVALPATSMTKGERTRQALLEAGVERFARDGYRRTSVAEIARDAGLSSTAAYVYFPNKEALFLAAVDEDAAAVIEEGLSSLTDDLDLDRWQQTLIYALLAAIGRHPLARRVLAGLEPEFTVRLLTIPALEQLRRVSADRLRRQQRAGQVRLDIDPVPMANGLVTIILSLLMSLLQTGTDAAAVLGPDVAAVMEAALSPLPVGSSPRIR